jgi:hypothetical protein
VKALSLATTANVVEDWDGKLEESVEACLQVSVLWGKEVDCVAKALR